MGETENGTPMIRRNIRNNVLAACSHFIDVPSGDNLLVAVAQEVDDVMFEALWMGVADEVKYNVNQEISDVFRTTQHS